MKKIFLFLLLISSQFAYSQSGKYTETGANSGPPLTTFYDKSKQLEILQQVRDRVLANQNNYQALMTRAKYFADLPTVTDRDNHWNQVCGNAAIAKNCAFLALVGVSPDGSTLSNRADYKARAITLLKDCHPFSLWKAFYWENQQYRAKELIMYLQALDYLELLSWNESGLNLSDDDKHDIEDELAGFAYSLHSRANNLLGTYDKMNNLSIISASAVGMAAVLLNGRSTWRKQKQPKRWINAANFYITRSLWHDDKQQSKRGEIGPFADGPGYFEYAFESAIPFFIAWNSFLDSKDHSGNYDESVLFSGSESVRNYMYDENYDNLYQWYNQIRMPNSFPPTYDDSWQQSNFGALGIARTNKVLNANKTYNVFKDEDFVNLRLEGTTGMNLYADFMIAVLPVNKTKKIEDKVNLNSGDIIIKSNHSSFPKDRHYLHINAEKNEALNGYRPFGIGHEHGDALNFIISAGEDLLIMDPSYLGYDNRSAINKGLHHNIITSNYAFVDDVLSPDPGSSEVNVTKIETSENYDFIQLEIDYHFLSMPKISITRTIEVIREDYYPLGRKIPRYHITDYVENLTLFNQEHKFHLNGNGNSSDPTPTLIDYPKYINRLVI